MKLWTIQKTEVYDRLKRDGVIHCDHKHSNFDTSPQWVSCYDWMNEKMNEHHITMPDNVQYPLWAWYAMDGLHKKPDLRRSAYDARGTKEVCITFNIPSSDVLLSDFNAWHYVLNNIYFAKEMLDDNYNEDLVDQIYDEFDKLDIATQEKLTRASWDNIFNFSLAEEDLKRRHRYVQATFYELRLDQVEKVQFFTAR